MSLRDCATISAFTTTLKKALFEAIFGSSARMCFKAVLRPFFEVHFRPFFRSADQRLFLGERSLLHVQRELFKTASRAVQRNSVP